jgi:hypothetical protein
MDETNRASAFASDNEWIGLVILITPADSALNLILTCIINILGSFNFHGFPQFLLIQLFFGHVNCIASEVLDSESHTTQLNGVKFFNLVVILAIFIL